MLSTRQNDIFVENMQNKIKLIEELSKTKKIINQLLQDEEFDYFSIQKKQETDSKILKLEINSLTNVYFSKILTNACKVNSKRNYILLNESFLEENDFDKYRSSIFILTNNDIGEKLLKYIDFYHRNPNSLFVIWDWDPQHWTYMSCMLAMHCDFYISSASENTYLLSHFNPYMLGPVLGGVNQWSRKLILENFSTLTNNRDDNPIGEHNLYPDFSRRNRAIQTLNHKVPGVKFSDRLYQKMSDEDNLRIWAKAKVHWIMPVLCGMPVRIHNAIVTGGIPLIPSFCKNLPEIIALGSIPLYYETIDLLEPDRINQLAIEKFNSQGEGGLIDRVLWGLKHNHIDHRIEEILVLVEDKIDQVTNNTRSYSLGYFR